MTKTIKLDLPLLLPDMEAGDECVHFLTERLAPHKGIETVHIVREGDQALLCLHYDPNLVSLGEVERLAKEAGATVTERYCHEQIRFAGLDAADNAVTLQHALSRLPGLLHVHVNYAASVIYVAYDSSAFDRKAFEATIRHMGARIVPPKAAPSRAEVHDEHDHRSAPAFLPHWVQERWEILLVLAGGIFLALGWFGEQFLGFSSGVATALYMMSYIAAGFDITTHAIPAILRGKFDTDVLMLAAAVGAAILGEWGEGAFLLFLFGLGHAGEHYALERARNAVNALGELMPRTARVRRGETIVEADVADLIVGDVVVVRPGDRIPVDGTVKVSQSAVDQSPITGESVPVQKEPGADVFAGTVNQDGALEIEVTRLAADNTLARVMTLVSEAQSQQSPTQQFTERFTAWFVPAVLIGTALVIIAPPLIGTMPLEASFYRGMLLLVAASPCALAIGTPATVLAGIAQAARLGVLIKGGVHLETLGRLRAIAFDKTGTITTGKFAVASIAPLNGATEADVLATAAAVEQQSNHPLAHAIVQAAREKKLSVPASSGLDNIAGRGVSSTVDGKQVLIGNLKLFQEVGGLPPDQGVTQTVETLEADGQTTMTISRNGQFLGVIGLADQTRPSAPSVMQRLKSLGVDHLVMLTGDNRQVAMRIAQAVALTDVRAELLPEDKLTVIKELETEYQVIGMVGDGVNDAPALATATVGIAMGAAGTAVALETADVALMADDLAMLPLSVRLSRSSRSIIRQNLWISLGVIGLLMVTSVFSIVPLSGAVLLHEGSTIVVVVNALRLLAFGIE
jgi:Cd2+/Zn2+-exporting ATPase